MNDERSPKADTTLAIARLLRERPDLSSLDSAAGVECYYAITENA